MRFVILILVVALLASLATYALLNIEERVDINLPWTVLRGQPQIFLVLVAMGVGALFVGVLSVADGIRLRFAVRRLRREVERLEQFPASVSPAVDLGAAHGANSEESQESAKDPAHRPVIPSAGRSSMTDDDPPYGV